jgi:hypothetical protein
MPKNIEKSPQGNHPAWSIRQRDAVFILDVIAPLLVYVK